jgi:transposase InsO family protein
MPCGGRWSWSERWCPQRRFQAVAVMAAEHIPVEVACRVLGVSTSGSYASRSRPRSQRSVRHAWLTDLIVEVHQRSRGTYGALRVPAELRLGRGILVGHNAVALLLRRAGLAGVTGRPKWRHAKPDQVATDLVDRQFFRTEPNQLWVTDSTEHPTSEGKRSCAVVLDIVSRRVVGWSIDAAPTAALVTTALGMAIDRRIHRPAWSSTPTRACSSLPGRSPSGPRTPAWCRRWQRRRRLRQRDDRGVLVADAGRAAEPSPLADPGRAGQRDR